MSELWQWTTLMPSKYFSLCSVGQRFSSWPDCNRKRLTMPIAPLFRIGAEGLAQVTLSLLLMLFPTALVRPVAQAMGHSIAPRARIGFSWLHCNQLVMASGARIGHFNLVLVSRMIIRSDGLVGHMNVCRGPISLRLGEGAKLGNRNTVARARKGVTFGPAQLCLAKGAVITAGHSLDCTQTIRFGAYSILAGKGSQIWTHGYVHEDVGSGRYRVDGQVIIGDNVYLGSSVIVTGGVSICDAASVGVGACVTKHLTEPGFYVSGQLRMLPKPANPEGRSDMERVTAPELIETVYRKRNARL